MPIERLAGAGGTAAGPLRRMVVLLPLAAALWALLLAGSALAQPTCKYGYDPAGNCREEPPPQTQGSIARVELRSTPPGAVVSEGGMTLGTAPFVANLRPGLHRLTFSLGKYIDVDREISVSKGTRTGVTVTLQALPTITIAAANDSARGALLSVDGVVFDRLPVIDRVLPRAGVHTLKVERESYEPFTLKDDFAPNTTRSISVNLAAQLGKLAVNGDLVGVPVFLDPDPDASITDPMVARGEFLGETPVAPRDVRAGKHVLVLEIWGLEPTSMIINVPANGKLDVPFGPPKLSVYYGVSPLDRSRWQSVDWKRVEAECRQKKRLEACSVAGYRAMHEGTPDPKLAEELYRIGCDGGVRQACLSVGYLLRKKDKDQKPSSTATTQADEWFAKACKAKGEPPDACWYQYTPLRSMSDPTMDPGPWDDFVPAPRDRSSFEYLEYSLLAGVGPFLGTPVYAEPEISFRLALFDSFHVSFGASLRARVIGRINEARTRQDWVFQMGPAADLGFLILPTGKMDFTIRPLVKLTAFVNATTAFGAGLLLGHSFGTHLLELGVLFDMMPLHVEPVVAFGEEQLFEHQDFMPVVCLRYSFWRPYGD